MPAVFQSKGETMKNKKHIVAFTLLIAASFAFAQSQNVAQNGAKYSFYPNGMLKSKVVSIGPHSYVKILFNENGSISRQKTIIMNAEEGDQRLYNKQGQLIEERRIYLAGHKYDIHLLKQFGENGKMTYYEDTTVQKHFFSNGNIRSIKDSTSEREYYENGSLKEETKDGIVYSHYTNYNDSSIVCESRNDPQNKEFSSKCHNAQGILVDEFSRKYFEDDVDRFEIRKKYSDSGELIYSYERKGRVITEKKY